jgi:hypothetical protein
VAGNTNFPKKKDFSLTRKKLFAKLDYNGNSDKIFKIATIPIMSIWYRKFWQNARPGRKKSGKNF